jgi:signal transduction histidine kinase
VHVPLVPPGRQPLAVAAAFDDRAVGAIRGDLVRRFLPLVLAPLVLLVVVQLLASLSLADRLRRKEEERAQLFSRALDISDRERARFAADLHDGPIQDLAGVGYALAALAPTVARPQAPLMQRIQDAVGRSVDSLRSLMTDLYPPDLHGGTLDQALDTLAEPLRQSGVGVEIDLERMPELERESAVTLYRVTREVLANVEKHARATHVTITATAAPQDEPGARERVRLVVADDGVGVDPRRLDRRREGHLGLRIVIDRVQNAGGQLTLTSSPGRGTRVEMELPTAT